MSKVKDFFYYLLRKRHLERWRFILGLPQSYIRIVLYLVHHNNQATKREIIENLTQLGGDPRSCESIERIIRYMKSDGTLTDSSGILSLKSPQKYLFTIKWIRGNLLDRWFTLAIPFSILALIFTFLGILLLAKVFIIIVIFFIIGNIIDDFTHVQSW